MNQDCAQCGVESTPESDRFGHLCDGCGRWICPTCFSKLETVYVGSVTDFGMVGYLKLCDECNKKYKPIKMTEHPFIG